MDAIASVVIFSMDIASVIIFSGQGPVNAKNTSRLNEAFTFFSLNRTSLKIWRELMRVYYSLAVWQFKPILSAGLRFHSHLSGGLRLKNYRAVAVNRFCMFLWRLSKQS